MVDFQKSLKNLKELPWRSISWLLALSFIGAALTSNLVSIWVMPDVSTLVAGSGLRGTGAVESFVKPTLTDLDLKIIYDRNLFNRTGELGDVEAADESEFTAEARKSDLPLKVLGIIYGGTPYNGLATIENKENSKINSFIVGDTLLRDAHVAEIHRTRVYITRSGGRREYLELENPEVVRSSRQRRTPTVTDNVVGAIATGPAARTFKEEGFERTDGEMVMSQDYRQRLLTQDFTKVLQDAKAVPNMVDGQIKGFRLERIREGSIYQKAGLQNGDVIEEINGSLLSDPGSAIRQLQSVRNESQVDVLVKRNGVAVPMRINVR